VSKAKGPRVLKTEKLDLWFREDRSIKEATASPDADLLVSPGLGEAPERRRITARVLAFQFDEQGRLAELLGQRDVVVSAEPLKRGAFSPRTVRAPAMVARLDPETGEIRRIEFDRGAEFQEGSRVGRGGAAVFEGEGRVLVLQDDPELSDAEEGTKLDAGTIEILSATGDVHARGGVQQTRKGKAEATTPQAVLRGGQAGSMIKAERLAYVAKTRTATYEGKAILRAGKDEVRADTLVLEEPGTGKRRLQARGEVVSLMYPRPRRGAPKEPVPVEGRAAEMVYDECSRKIVYAGGAVLKQGEIVTRSPEATLILNQEGTEVERLEAGEPAEIEQGPRRATGRRATYTPGNETVVIVGDNAILKDPGQQVEGQVLTFHVGDDRILVDGKEHRTTAVIHREPRSP
jgi:lipopolysaccharide export system protein LptA